MDRGGFARFRKSRALKFCPLEVCALEFCPPPPANHIIMYTMALSKDTIL